jgi:hypothetical protein
MTLADGRAFEACIFNKWNRIESEFDANAPEASLSITTRKHADDELNAHDDAEEAE